MNIDLSFYNLEMIRQYVLNGFLFSIQLTVVATIGGIFFGTLLALMRLSGKPSLTIPAGAYVNMMRSILARAFQMIPARRMFVKRLPIMSCMDIINIHPC